MRDARRECLRSADLQLALAEAKHDVRLLRNFMSKPEEESGARRR